MIKKVQIENFKSLVNVEASLSPLSVLIGRSGTGKTNFVAAFRFIREFLSGGNANMAFLQKWGGWAAIRSALIASRRMQFTVTFNVDGISEDLEYSLTFTANHPNVDEFYFASESLKRGEQTIFSQNNNQWITPPRTYNAPPPGSPAIGVLYGIDEAQTAYQFFTKGIGCYDFPNDVLQVKGQQRSRIAGGMADDGANYLDAFESIFTNVANLAPKREIESALRHLSPTAATIDLDSKGGNEIYVGHRSGQNPALPFKLSQQSEGFRRFLAHMLAIYQNPPKQVLMFEEPEKGLYPGALQVLAEIFQETVNSGRQVILTTHNPVLLDYFDADALRVVTIENYATKIGPLATDQAQNLREHLMRTGELLTVDEARIDGEVPATTSEATN